MPLTVLGLTPCRLQLGACRCWLAQHARATVLCDFVASRCNIYPQMDRVHGFVDDYLLRLGNEGHMGEHASTLFATVALATWEKVGALLLDWTGGPFVLPKKKQFFFPFYVV